MRCFVTGIESPPESLTWFRELEKHLSEEEIPMYRMSLYAHRASTVCAKIRTFLKHGSARTSTAGTELLEQAALFETELRQSWDGDGDADEAEETKTASLQFRLLICRTFFYAFQLKFQLTILELLNKIRLETHDVDSVAVQKQFRHRVTRVEGAADEIISCVPLLFATDGTAGSKSGPRLWVDGVRVLWPLRLVAFWPATREDQKVAAQSTLHQIRDELGVRPRIGAFVPSIYVS